MGKIEMVAKGFVWWIVPIGLVFLAIVSFMPKQMSSYSQGVIFALLSVVAIAAILFLERWKDWLRE